MSKSNEGGLGNRLFFLSFSDDEPFSSVMRKKQCVSFSIPEKSGPYCVLVCNSKVVECDKIQGKNISAVALPVLLWRKNTLVLNRLLLEKVDLELFMETVALGSERDVSGILL